MISVVKMERYHIIGLAAVLNCLLSSAMRSGGTLSITLVVFFYNLAFFVQFRQMSSIYVYITDLLFFVGENFLTYQHGEVNMKVYHVNIETEEVREPVSIRVEHNILVGNLKEQLSKFLSIDVSTMRVAFVKMDKNIYYLENKGTVPSDTESPIFKLYVANSFDEDTEKAFNYSPFKNIVERFESVVHLGLLLPETDPGNGK